MSRAAKKVDYSAFAKEADIQLAIRELLTYMGIPHSITDASRTWSEKGRVAKPKVDQGWPDLSGTIPWVPNRGISLYIETKAARTGFQPGQRERHAMLRKAGAIVLVPRSLKDFARKMIESGIDHDLLRQI
jgi:hypothetical protein